MVPSQRSLKPLKPHGTAPLNPPFGIDSQAVFGGRGVYYTGDRGGSQQPEHAALVQAPDAWPCHPLRFPKGWVEWGDPPSGLAL